MTITTKGSDSTRFDLIEVDSSKEEIEALRIKRLETTVAGQLQLRQEKAEAGSWVPACCGTEVPFFTRERRRLLYCWQPSTGRHAYLDCDTDLILSDEEARLALNMN